MMTTVSEEYAIGSAASDLEGGEAHQKDEQVLPRDGTAAHQQAPPKALSVISQQYDRGHKGYLDNTEQKLRQLDTDNAGHLDVHKVYELMTVLQREQQKSLMLKHVVWALCGFAVLLCLANIGTSFAAATLAKDTSVSSGNSHMLVVKGTDQAVGVVERVDIIELNDAPDEEQPAMNMTDGGLRRLVGGAPNMRAFRIGHGAADKLMRQICSNWGATSGRTVKDWDGSNFKCGSGGRAATCRHCGNQVQSELKWRKRPTLKGEKVTFFFDGNRDGHNYHNVRVTCPNRNDANAKCRITGLSCDTTCNVCQMNGDSPTYTWFCSEQDECGCFPEAQSACRPSTEDPQFCIAQCWDASIDA